MITGRASLFSSLILLVSVSKVFSQKDTSDSVYYALPTKPIEYFFNIQIGALVGCNDCNKGKDFTFSATTVEGITIGNKFRVGVGLGFDSYQNWQTLPLYGMASWDLIGNKTKNALFVQINYGWAHPWFIRDGAYSNYFSDPFTDVNGGRMINPQIGYRISYYNLKLSIAAGYKFQQLHYKKPSYYYPNCPMCDLPQQSLDEVTQDMNRAQIMMSVGWK